MSDYPIKGFLETSFSDWPGKVTAVLFLPSCNFRCLFCHNPELVLRPDRLPDYPLQAILDDLRRRRGWVDGVCVTGGEPTVHEWLPDLIQALRSAPGLEGPGPPLEIKLDTNGTHPQMLRKLIAAGLVDSVAMDLKGPLEIERYSAITGTSQTCDDLNRIQTSIEILLSGRVHNEFRTTLVPSFMDEEEILSLARRVRGAERYTLQNLRPQNALDERVRALPPWGEEELRRLQSRVNEIIKDVS